MAKILVVEDDEALRLALEGWLVGQNHTVEFASTGQQGLELMTYYQFDVIVLDWNLPDVSGLQVCQTYRSQSGKVPIIMLTAKSHINEKKTGLDAGADDYLTKPFHLEELTARIRALLRRAVELRPAVLQARDITLDPASGKVTKGGAEIHLLPREFALLEFFLRHPGRAFDAEALIARVWKSDSDITTEAIRPYIRRLRSKIDSPNEDSLIQTVLGKGYMLKNEPD